MLQRQIDDRPDGDAAEAERLTAAVADARGVIDDARELLAQGGGLVDAAAGRAGAKLVQLGALDGADDVRWLELEEVREALRSSTTMRAAVERRKAAAAPAASGAVAPPDTPELYLVPEILALIGPTPDAAS